MNHQISIVLSFAATVLSKFSPNMVKNRNASYINKTHRVGSPIHKYSKNIIVFLGGMSYSRKGRLTKVEKMRKKLGIVLQGKLHSYHL